MIAPRTGATLVRHQKIDASPTMIAARVIRDDYFGRRIASPDLLPGGDRPLPHQTCYRKRWRHMSKISTETRRELVASIQERYRSASLLDQQRILDEFIALTGYHRKHAIRVLGSGSSIDSEQAETPPRAGLRASGC